MSLEFRGSLYVANFCSRTWPKNHDIQRRIETILMVVAKKFLGIKTGTMGLEEQLVLGGYHYS